MKHTKTIVTLLVIISILLIGIVYGVMRGIKEHANLRHNQEAIMLKLKINKK